MQTYWLPPVGTIAFHTDLIKKPKTNKHVNIRKELFHIYFLWHHADVSPFFSHLDTTCQLIVSTESNFCSIFFFFSLCVIQICQTTEPNKALLLTLGLRQTAESLCWREFFHMSLLSAYLLPPPPVVFNPNHRKLLQLRTGSVTRSVVLFFCLCWG